MALPLRPYSATRHSIQLVQSIPPGPSLAGEASRQTEPLPSAASRHPQQQLWATSRTSRASTRLPTSPPALSRAPVALPVAQALTSLVPTSPSTWQREQLRLLRCMQTLVIGAG